LRQTLNISDSGLIIYCMSAHITVQIYFYFNIDLYLHKTSYLITVNHSVYYICYDIYVYTQTHTQDELLKVTPFCLHCAS
jgi:hypothetical protein